MADNGSIGGEEETEKGMDRVISTVLPERRHFEPIFFHEEFILLKSPICVKVVFDF